MEESKVIQAKEYWDNLKPGTIINLSDTQTMITSLGSTDGNQEKMFTIRDIEKIQEIDDLCRWYICLIDSLDGESLYLVAKVVDDVADVGIFFHINDITPSNRQGLIEEQELFWLFQEPDDVDADYIELKFTETFSLEMSDEFKGSFEVEYSQTDVGPIQGIATYSPESSGFNGSLGTVVEFSSDSEDTENNRAMIIEVGKKDNEEGGLIRVLIGDYLSIDFDLNIMS